MNALSERCSKLQYLYAKGTRFAINAEEETKPYNNTCASLKVVDVSGINSPYILYNCRRFPTNVGHWFHFNVPFHFTQIGLDY